MPSSDALAAQGIVILAKLSLNCYSSISRSSVSSSNTSKLFYSYIVDTGDAFLGHLLSLST